MSANFSFSILARHADAQTFDAGSTVFEAGDQGDCLYVVKNGQVSIRLKDRTVETVGPGGIVGEMALIEPEPRSATVVAETDCELVPLDSKRFTFLVQEMPNFALDVMRVLANRLRRQDQVSC